MIGVPIRLARMILLASFGVLFLSCASKRVPQGFPLRNPTRDSQQIILVVTRDLDAVNGTLQAYERADVRSAWKPVSGPVEIVVGRSGLAWGDGPAWRSTLAVTGKERGRR